MYILAVRKVFENLPI